MRLGLRSTYLVGSTTGAFFALLIVAAVVSREWQHGDEQIVAALLLGASFCSGSSLVLALAGVRTRGRASGVFWLVLLIAIVALLATWRTWGVL